MKPWYLYLLRCQDGTLYTGISNDVKKRLAAHAGGRGARYLRGRGPLTLARKLCVGCHGDALRLERRVKRLRRDKKEKLVAGKIRLKDLIAEDLRRQTVDASKKKDSRTRKEALNDQQR